MTINPYESPRDTKPNDHGVTSNAQLMDQPSTTYQVVATITLAFGIVLGTVVAIFTVFAWISIGFGLLLPTFAVVTCVIIGAFAALGLHLLMLSIVCYVFGIKQYVNQPTKETNLNA